MTLVLQLNMWCIFFSFFQKSSLYEVSFYSVLINLPFVDVYALATPTNWM